MKRTYRLDLMRVARYAIRKSISTLTPLAAWLALLRAYPFEATLGCLVGIPLIALTLWEMMLDGWKDRGRRGTYLTLLRIGASGIVALGLRLACGGGVTLLP